jgi:hypothetical protein
MAPGTRREHVLRSSGSLVVWLLGVALGLLALVDLAVGDVAAFWRVLAPLLLVLWALGMVLARPCIRYDEDRLVLVNPGVVHALPWAAVAALERGQQIVVVTPDRRITSWGAPPAPRRRVLRKDAPPDWAYAELEGAWQTARAAQESRRSPAAPPSRRPDVPALAVGAVLLVATVVTVLL